MQVVVFFVFGKKSFFRYKEVLKDGRWLCVKDVIQESSFECVIGLVYSPHNREEKNILWEELLEVKNHFNVPMLLMGDLMRF